MILYCLESVETIARKEREIAFVVSGRVMFCAIISLVKMYRSPVKTKLALYHAVTEKVEYQVHGIDIA